ncbi:MAG TPA: DUF58 domain-containing protein [Steroidobacteraceae bacterium]|nr:DUF58 domain-containing protein [Steroidobacteraceae bacterium]
MPTLFQRKMAAWILRRQGIDRFPLELRRRRLYILPTRAGLGFGVVVLGMLVAALNYGNSIALLLTCLLGGFVLVAMHQAHRNLAGLELASATTTPAFAGERGGLSVRVVNDSPLARYRLEIDALGAPPATADLAPQSSHEIRLEVPVPRRGLMRIDRFRISTTHPFGLFRAWSWVHAPLTLVVFPRPRGARPVPPHAGGPRGQARAAGAERDEWVGLRAFRDGDSPRQVAWKAYARGAPLLTKEYAASGSQQRCFEFDRLEGLDTEQRLEQLARWVVDAEARGESYGLVLSATRLPPEHGPEHRRRALTALALHGSASP